MIMRIILVYDVGEKRVQKVHKFLKRYLHWIQNSVFEGDLTTSELEEVKAYLKKLMNEDEDSIIIFKLKFTNYNKEILGLEKNSISTII